MGLAIAHVLSSLGVGGQERVALNLGKIHRSQGHTVRVAALSSKTKTLENDFLAADIEPTFFDKSGGGFDWKLVLSLARWLHQKKIDVVHTHNPLALLYGGPAAHLARARWVHSKHGANPASQASLLLRRGLGYSCDAFVAVSNATANVARQKKECRLGKLHVIVNGIDEKQFVPNSASRARIRQEIGISEDAFLGISVGRLVPEKNLSMMIRAWAPLLGADRQLLIVGGGSSEPALKSQVQALSNGSYIHLLGPRRDIPDLMAAADAFVMSSDLEGLPLVIPEAMAAELPVVATDVGGISEIVKNDHTGRLVSRGDESGLRAQLQWLDTHRDTARQWGRNGRERVLAEFSLTTMSQRYFDLYRGGTL